MPPTREDFARWKDDFVTRYIFRALEIAFDDQKRAWTDASWINGHANPLLLQELRTRADAYASLSDTSYEGWLEMNNDVEPNG